MRSVLRAGSGLSLVVLLAVPSLGAFGLVSPELSLRAILFGTIGWFATALLWMRPRAKSH